jgi:hypothetical protein
VDPDIGLKTLHAAASEHTGMDTGSPKRLQEKVDPDEGLKALHAAYSENPEFNEMPPLQEHTSTGKQLPFAQIPPAPATKPIIFQRPNGLYRKDQKKLKKQDQKQVKGTGNKGKTGR